jgi:hypothetical protein
MSEKAISRPSRRLFEPDLDGKQRFVADGRPFFGRPLAQPLQEWRGISAREPVSRFQIEFRKQPADNSKSRGFVRQQISKIGFGLREAEYPPRPTIRLTIRRIIGKQTRQPRLARRTSDKPS